MLQGLTDRDLVRAARNGSRAAFGELVERHGGTLLTVCRRMLGAADGAEDARQEAVLRALLTIDRLADPDRFAAWLAGIGLNVLPCLIRQQRRPTASDTELADLADPEDGPEAHALAIELAERVHEAIETLPAGQRQAVTLFYQAGLDQATTAAQLEIPIGALKSRLHKGRAALRQPLASLWEGKPMETTAQRESLKLRSSASGGTRRRRLIEAQAVATP